MNRVDLQLPQGSSQKGSQNVACEPSIDEKDESEESSSEEYQDNIDFNMKSKEALEASEEVLTSKDLSPTGPPRTKPFEQLEINQDEEIKKNSPAVIESIDNQDKTADASCNVPVQTGMIYLFKPLISKVTKIKLKKLRL